MYDIIWSSTLLKELHENLFLCNCPRTLQERHYSHCVAQRKLRHRETGDLSSVPQLVPSRGSPTSVQQPEALSAPSILLKCLMRASFHHFGEPPIRVTQFSCVYMPITSSLLVKADSKKCLCFPVLCQWDLRLAPQDSDCERSNIYMTLPSKYSYHYLVFLWPDYFITEKYFIIADHLKH